MCYHQSPFHAPDFFIVSGPGLLQRCIDLYTILKFEDMYTMQISLFVYDLNNDLLPKSFRNVLS